MSMEADLRSWLIANESIGALVSDRVFPAYLPNGTTMPALVITRDPSSREYTTEGAAIVQGSVHLFTFGETYAQADTLKETVKSALNNQDAELTTGGTRLILAQLETDNAPIYDFEVARFYADLAFTVLYSE